MVRFGLFRLDAANAMLWRGDTAVPLAPKPFEVLCHLVSRDGALVTKEELLEAVWPGLHVGDSSLGFAINAVRTALGDNAKAPVYIQTVQRRGFRFIAKVEVVASSTILPSPEPGAAATAWLTPARPRWRVGRTAPLDQVEALLPLVSAGHRQLVFVTGEPGIGKTTFIEMVMERVSRDDICVLTGRCTERFGTNEAFLPLIEALQAYCSGPDGASLLKALRENAPTWLAQMPKFLDDHDRANFQSEVAGATRERMLREFCDLMEVIGADRRRVIVIEDLHWSDLATIDVLSHFSRRNRPARVLILATYRPADVAMAGHPVRSVHQDLRIRGHCRDIELGRLTRNDVRNYLSLRFNDAAFTEAITDEIFRRTGGQPLFVVSMSDYFVDKGILFEANGCWHLDIGHADIRAGVPWELRDMITRQIDALVPDQRQVLEVASAVGTDFSAAVVASATSRDVVDVEQAFEAMARAGQIVARAGVSDWPDGTAVGHYAFQHDLYQEVVYERLAPGQLVRTHRCIGEAVEKAYQSCAVQLAPVLALHFENGRDIAKAVHYLGKAAEHAAQRFASREAANYLSRALGLVDRLPLESRPIPRIRLLQQRGWVQRSAGDLAGPLEDLNAMIACAAEAGLPHLEVRGLVDLSRFSLFADRRQCLQAATRALAMSDSLDDDVFKAIVRGSSASIKLYLTGWHDDEAEFCHNAIKLTADARDPNIVMRRCAIESVVECLRSEYLTCSVAARSGKEFALATGDVYLFALYNCIEAVALLHLGHWRTLQMETAAAVTIAERNTHSPAATLCRLTGAWLHAEAFDFPGAKALCDQTEDIAHALNPMIFYFRHTILAKVYLGMGDAAEAAKHLDEILVKVEKEGNDLDFPIRTEYIQTFCEYWLTVGDVTRARELAMRLFDLAAPAPCCCYLAVAHKLLATIALFEGDHFQARTCIMRAISCLELAQLPLVAWRTYRFGVHLFEKLEDQEMAADCSRRCQQNMQVLAANFDRDEPLWLSLQSMAAGSRAEFVQYPLRETGICQ